MSRAGADARRGGQDAELEARAREIYHEILRRTPEHDFDPTDDSAIWIIRLPPPLIMALTTA